MEDDNLEIDIDKILAEAEEKTKAAVADLDKAGDSIMNKFSLDEIESINVYDYEGLLIILGKTQSFLYLMESH